MSRVAIGIMVFNEAENLPALLPRLMAMDAPDWTIDPIMIVSSGSTDGSVEIARTFEDSDRRIQVIVESKRTGKATAINRFLRAVPAETEVCVLVSGDVIPQLDALRHLLAPFADASVGMTGARPIPTNPPRGWLNRVVRFQWDVHHRVATRTPKLGEMVAFRRVVPGLDPLTPVDEASMEAEMVGRRARLVYTPAAVVHNRGPSTLREFLCQRQRIWSGHLRLRRRTGYAVATYRVVDLVMPVLAELWSHPSRLPVAVLAACLETLARVRGSVEHLLLGRTPSTWPALPSTKAPVG